MNVEQHFSKGRIQGEALARLDSLYSIFARAATLSARADFARVRTAIETLRALGLAAAAVSSSGQAIIAYDDFSATSHVWTTRGGDRIVLRDGVAQKMLTEALGGLARSTGVRSLPLRAEPGSKVTGVLQIVPIRRAAHDVFGNSSAILILSEPKGGIADAKLIQSLFDLTPPEIAIAQAIAQGQSVAAIAKATGKATSTVRNQLASVMAKTGSSRQTELALLIRQLGDPRR